MIKHWFISGLTVVSFSLLRRGYPLIPLTAPFGQARGARRRQLPRWGSGRGGSGHPPLPPPEIFRTRTGGLRRPLVRYFWLA
jgi:hypothetical protein